MLPDNAAQLRRKVRDLFSAVAESPEGKYTFPVGRRFAESLGYPVSLLDELPAVASEAFTGVSNLAVIAEIPEGSTVLDLGCGGGLDALVAGRRVGSRGRVLAVDFAVKMLARARLAVQIAGTSCVDLVNAAAESLPLITGSIDVAIVNGIFNLNPAREGIFEELARVVRREGTVYAAELIVKDGHVFPACSSEDDWFT